MFEYFIYLFVGVSVLACIYYNGVILRSDWINKKIPNRGLCLLVLTLPGTLYWYNKFVEAINWQSWITSIIVLISLSVGLYAGKIWGAWDAKYCIVLSLFLLNSNFLLFLNYLIVTTGIWIILSLIWEFARGASRWDQHIDHPFKISIHDLHEKWQKVRFSRVVALLVQLSTLWLCSVYITRWVTQLWANFAEPHRYGVLLSAVLLLCYLLLQWISRFAQAVRKRFFVHISPRRTRAIGTIFCALILAGLCLNFWVTLVLYDLRDVIKYAIPTLLLLFGVYYLLGAGIYARDYSSVSIESLHLGDTLYAPEVARNLHAIMKQKNILEIPHPSSIEEAITGTLTAQKIANLREYAVLAGQHPDHSFVARVKNHPFAHIILISYLGSIFLGVNILGAAIKEWYFYINQIWYFVF